MPWLPTERMTGYGTGDLRNNSYSFHRWKSMLGCDEKEISNHPRNGSRIHPDDRLKWKPDRHPSSSGRNPT